MTPRMIEVWTLIAEGLCNKDIATRLRINEKTVKATATRVFRALKVDSRTQAVMKFYRVDLRPIEVNEQLAQGIRENLPEEEPLDLRKADVGHIASNE